MIKRGKKGVSSVVITILFIALALGAVLLVWGLVRTQLAESSAQIAITKACLDLQLETISCKYDANSNVTEVRYKRGTGDVSLSLTKVRLIFELEDGSSDSLEASGIEVPDLLETVYKPGINLNDRRPVRFSLAGVLETVEGEERLCGEAPLTQACSPL